MVKASLTYSEADARVIRDASVGDVITLQGQRVRLLKKTNQAVAVVPYTLLDRVEDWVLAKLGNWLP